MSAQRPVGRSAVVRAAAIRTVSCAAADGALSGLVTMVSPDAAHAAIASVYANAATRCRHIDGASNRILSNDGGMPVMLRVVNGTR